MRIGKNLVIVGFVIVVFVILQGILIAVDKVDNPAETAVDFTKAYFMLDGASMSELLCNEIIENQETDVVDAYLNSVAEKARSMGFSPDYMKNQLSDITTEIQKADGNTARVRITGERMRSINPVYAFIGRLFFLIETHRVDETLTLVREDDRWKVCGKPFSLRF